MAVTLWNGLCGTVTRALQVWVQPGAGLADDYVKAISSFSDNNTEVLSYFFGALYTLNAVM
jgi:hypothetical protein